MAKQVSSIERKMLNHDNNGTHDGHRKRLPPPSQIPGVSVSETLLIHQATTLGAIMASLMVRGAQDMI
jgi:hypothetical protein